MIANQEIQREMDRRNAQFWNEVCGSAFARSLGITELSPASLFQFDQEYFRFYPYLQKYLSDDVTDAKVLEIGLGFGTVGQHLANKGCRYYGLDIAANPVAMMRYRFSLLGLEGSNQVQVGSALDIPFKNSSFDYVYSIGCLHHTGDLPRAITEVHRVLAERGKAIIMLYNSHSFSRLLKVPLLRVHKLLVSALLGRRGQSSYAELLRRYYDRNSSGEGAPHTDFVSSQDVQKLFKDYSTIQIEKQNSEALRLRGRVIMPRERLLNNLGRLMGINIYITATK
jgi:ubiquinone/menaquinone biosynthesis C-methylase UbiE